MTPLIQIEIEKVQSILNRPELLGQERKALTIYLIDRLLEEKTREWKK